MAHFPDEFVRDHIPLGDRLLVTVLSGTEEELAGSPPWNFVVRDIGLNVLASGSVASTQTGTFYQYLDLDSGTFGPTVGQSHWLEIYTGTLNASGSPHILSRFHISGIYEERVTTLKLAGLLGENMVIIAPSGTDYQSGHQRHSRVLIYEDNTLSTLIHEFEFSRTFVKDFIADHRFFLQNESERED